MEPFEKYIWCISIVRKLYQFIFLDIFSQSQSLRHSIGAYVLITVYIGLALSVAIDSFNRTGSAIFISLTFFMAFFQLTLILVLTKLNVMRPMVDIATFVGDVYRKNSEKTQQYYKVCTKYANFSELMVKAFMAMVLGMCVIVTIITAIEYFFKENPEPPLQLFIPGVNEYEGAMLAILFVYNYIFMVGNFVIHNSTTLMIYVTFTNIIMLSEILIGSIKYLEHLLEVRSKNQSKNTYEIEMVMIEVCLMHRKYLQ